MVYHLPKSPLSKGGIRDTVMKTCYGLPNFRLHSIPGLWALGSPLLYTRLAWAARSTAYRGQWTLADLIGAVAVVGVLAALVAFFFWPRRPS
jgi:hypothetical protein